MAFHVPEMARIYDGPLASMAVDGNNGAFDLESLEPGWRLALICSDGKEAPEEPTWQWEHVSVHAYRGHGRQLRTPTWKEMAYVKALCWDDEDTVVQYHPRKSEYVNNHPNVLHLWKPTEFLIPTPPSVLIGFLDRESAAPAGG